MYHWFIHNPHNNDFVGYLNISTYVNDRPSDYTETLLLEIGGALSEKYRNRRIASKLAEPVLEKLSTFEDFPKGIFCIDTRTDNNVVHKIVAKNWTLILRRDREFDFGIFTKAITCDLFIISPR
jgi:hypothetical protein